MLQFLKKLFFKKRRYPRYLVNNGSFVVVLPVKDGDTIKWKVKVLDISLGGAAFVYEGSPDDLAKSGLVSISADLPEAADYKTIWDFESSAGSTYRRRGVKFEWKGFLGKKQLVEFIKEYGLLME